jgi:HTH-type transcriptional regulator/antitoxin HigA
MTIKPIKTEQDYHKALKQIEKYWDAKPNTPNGDRLDVLVTLVEAYEQKHYKINPPDLGKGLTFILTRKNAAPESCLVLLRAAVCA